MKHRFLYPILLLAIATVKAKGDNNVGAGNAVGNNDLGIIVKKNDPGNRGRSINDSDDHSGNEELNKILENDNLNESQGNSSVTNGTTSSTTPTSTTSNDPSKNTNGTTITTPSTELPSKEDDYPYQVRGENDTSCILSKMTISLIVTYNNTNQEAVSKLINISSSNIMTDGYCSEPYSAMQLTWPVVETASTKASPRMNNITFSLEKNDEDSTYSVFEILVLIRLDPFNFPDALEADILETTGPNLMLFRASSINGKYKCDIPTIVNTERVEITMTDIVLIAFNTDKDVSSKSEENCVLNFVETIHSIEIWGIAGVIGVVFAAIIITIIIGIIMLLRKKNSSNHRMDDFYK